MTFVMLFCVICVVGYLPLPKHGDEQYDLSNRGF